MRRRRFLTALPLAAGLTGCLDASGPDRSSTGSADGQSPNGTRTPTEATASPTPGETLPAAAVKLRAAFRYVINVDGIAVEGPVRDQFAFVDPPVSGEQPPPDAFELVLGDDHFVPSSSAPGWGPWTPGVDAVYSDSEPTGWLKFDVPTTETAEAALRYEGTRHPLAEEAREALATAPAFSSPRVSVPESVTAGEEIELRVTVTNEGDAPGTYLAGFRTGGHSKSVDVPVGPGETATGAVTYDAPHGIDGLSFHVTYPGGNETYGVAIEAGPTETR